MSEYVLTNGKKYIHVDSTGRYSQVNNLCNAEMFSSQKQAENIKLNSITKALSRTYYVAKVENGEVIQCDVPRPEAPQHNTNDNNSVYRFEDYLADEILADYATKFESVADIFNECSKEGNKIAQNKSDIDLKITDLEHYIEFTSLNARDGYKAYKMLKDLLRERRRLKLKAQMINSINRNRSSLEQINNILSSFHEISNYKYKPRILHSLFEKGIDSI